MSPEPLPADEPEARVRVELPSHGSRGRVWLDGNEVSHLVQAVSVRGDARKLTVVTLELAQGSALLSASGAPSIGMEAYELLVSLGWTPPGQPIKPEVVASADGRVLCSYCDVWVGWAGSAAIMRPDESPEWLGSHCWSCKRHESQVVADPYRRLR